MIRISRRRFSKHLVVAAAVPLVEFVRDETKGQEQATSPTSLPDIIVGYRLTDEDKRLAAKFLTTHEKSVGPLRETDLPNALAPSCIFVSPRQKPGSEPQHQRGARQQ
jgi:hypothetical protein